MNSAVALLLIQAFKNLGMMFVSKKAVIWAVRTLPKLSKTEVDDNIGLIIEGAINNDTDKVLAAAEEVIKALSKKPIVVINTNATT